MMSWMMSYGNVTLCRTRHNYPTQRYDPMSMLHVTQTWHASPDASHQKRIKCDPYVTPSPTHLEVPSLPEPTTTLIFYKNMNTDTHNTETYDKALILHIIFLSRSGTSKQIKVSIKILGYGVLKGLLRSVQQGGYECLESHHYRSSTPACNITTSSSATVVDHSPLGVLSSFCVYFSSFSTFSGTSIPMQFHTDL